MNMTNEQKAREILVNHHYNEETFYAAMEMAEWKEKQMIEKAYNWIEDHITEYIGRSDWMGEDFKKAMKEN